MTTGRVAWITGLPSSGKSTLARRVQARLAAVGRAAVLLDGDEVRAALVPAPGYGAAERDDFYETLGRLAALLAGQGLAVLVAATANRRAHRDRARARCPRFLEVWLRAPPEVCQARHAKGLWGAARAGAAPDLPGAGVPYEPPLRPDLVAEGGEDEAVAAELTRWLLADGPAGAAQGVPV